MQSASIVGQQVLVMFLTALTGAVCCRMGMLTVAAARVFSGFLLNVALPSVIITSLYRPLEPHHLKGFLTALVFGALGHLLGIAVAHLLVRKREGRQYRSERFAVIYVNCAFVAFPLLRATVGEDGVLYAGAVVANFLVFQWTNGLLELGGKVNPRKMLLNSGVIAVAVGLLLMAFYPPVPAPLMQTVASLGSLTTPLSMVILGVFLADLKLSSFRLPRLFYAALLRMAVVPALCMAALWALGVSGWFEGAKVVCIALALSFSCPTAVSVILMNASLGEEVTYPSKLVAVTTAVSLLSLPLVTAVAERIF